jgi:hypothetical protein
MFLRKLFLFSFLVIASFAKLPGIKGAKAASVGIQETDSEHWFRYALNDLVSELYLKFRTTWTFENSAHEHYEALRQVLLEIKKILSASELKSELERSLRKSRINFEFKSPGEFNDHISKFHLNNENMLVAEIRDPLSWVELKPFDPRQIPWVENYLRISSWNSQPIYARPYLNVEDISPDDGPFEYKSFHKAILSLETGTFSDHGSFGYRLRVKVSDLVFTYLIQNRFENFMGSPHFGTLAALAIVHPKVPFNLVSNILDMAQKINLAPKIRETLLKAIQHRLIHENGFGRYYLIDAGDSVQIAQSRLHFDRVYKSIAKYLEKTFPENPIKGLRFISNIPPKSIMAIEELLSFRNAEGHRELEATERLSFLMKLVIRSHDDTDTSGKSFAWKQLEKRIQVLKSMGGNQFGRCGLYWQKFFAFFKRL